MNVLRRARLVDSMIDAVRPTGFLVVDRDNVTLSTHENISDAISAVNASPKARRVIRASDGIAMSTKWGSNKWNPDMVDGYPSTHEMSVAS